MILVVNEHTAIGTLTQFFIRFAHANKTFTATIELLYLLKLNPLLALDEFGIFVSQQNLWIIWLLWTFVIDALCYVRSNLTTINLGTLFIKRMSKYNTVIDKC
jgi:hypothetical protein